MKVTFSDTQETNDNVLTSRIISFELPDVMTLVKTGGNSESWVIRYRPRPGKERDNSEFAGSDSINSDSENQNIIVNIKKLEELFFVYLGTNVRPQIVILCSYS